MKAAKADAEEAGEGRISRGVEISGDVVFSDVLQVEGRVTGKLVSESGTLTIEQTGDVQADVDVGISVIRGTVQGNVRAKSRVEIYRTARVQGDITTPILLVEEGAQLSGNIQMGKDASRPGKQPPVDSTEMHKSKGA